MLRALGQLSFRRSCNPYLSPLSGRTRHASSNASADIRARLMTELKSAMKAKDTVKSITIRSVLSEVYAMDKSTPDLASSSTILGILRKAATRRTDAAAEFTKASRPDLAEKEQQEAAILQEFLPPLLPQSDIDRVLSEVLADPALIAARKSAPQPKALGQVFKGFYAKVDKSTVDPDIVRQRAQALLAANASA